MSILNAGDNPDISHTHYCLPKVHTTLSVATYSKVKLIKASYILSRQQPYLNSRQNKMLDLSEHSKIFSRPLNILFLVHYFNRLNNLIIQDKNVFLCPIIRKLYRRIQFINTSGLISYLVETWQKLNYLGKTNHMVNQRAL